MESIWVRLKSFSICFIMQFSLSCICCYSANAINIMYPSYDLEYIIEKFNSTTALIVMKEQVSYFLDIIEAIHGKNVRDNVYILKKPIGKEEVSSIRRKYSNFDYMIYSVITATTGLGVRIDTVDMDLLKEVHRLTFALTESGIYKFYKSYNNHLINLKRSLNVLVYDEADDVTQSFWKYLILMLCLHSIAIFVFLIELLFERIKKKGSALKKWLRHRYSLLSKKN